VAHPALVGAVLRVDLRGYSGDAPVALGTPVRDAEAGDGTRSLFYDLGDDIAGQPMQDACLQLARVLDRMFLMPEEPPFADAFAKRMRLDLGIGVGADPATWSHDLPHGFLSALADAETELGLTYYPFADELDAIVEEI
jgi:hypothetical protein